MFGTTGNGASGTDLSERGADPSAWLLELGAEARRAEFRTARSSSQGLLLGWGSRRAEARARRRLVEQALATVETPLSGPAPDELSGRIGAYTITAR